MSPALRRFWLAFTLTSLGVIAALIFGPTSRCGATGAYQNVAMGGGRSYDLHVPALLPPTPTIYLMLHGVAQTPAKAESYSGMTALADQRHFILAYPSSSDGSWNAGRCCGTARDHGVDDLGFLDRVLADLHARYPSASPNVRVVGFSNGGMLAYAFACTRNEVIGVAVVSGADTGLDCARWRALTVIELHGDRDTIVPLHGGYSKRLGMVMPPIARPHWLPASGVWSVRVQHGGGHDWPADGATRIWSALGALR